MEQKSCRERIIVYGIGSYYKEICSEIHERYEVVSYVDRNIQPRYGLQISSIDEALKVPYDKILLTILDTRAYYDVIRRLVEEYHVKADRILLGCIFQFEKKEISYYLRVNENGNIVLEQRGISITTRNIDELNNVLGIYGSNHYGYFLDGKKDVVLDIGMNVGGAALFFANMDNVKNVYAYEPFMETYLQAEENIKTNDKGRDKIKCFQYGISDRTEHRTIIYNAQMSCGQSTVQDKNIHARGNYQDWNLITEQDDRTENVLVKDIKEVFTEICTEHTTENIVLKMNCEGEEYSIIQRMDECGLFERVKIIMAEWHYDGREGMTDILEKNGFMYWNIVMGPETGMVYAVNMKQS